MTYIIAILGFVLLSVALWDAFEVIMSRRRVIVNVEFIYSQGKSINPALRNGGGLSTAH
jgi:hypothetical protein